MPAPMNDKWKTCEELVRIDGSSETHLFVKLYFRTVSLYKELSHTIKASLKNVRNNVRKESPAVKIEMPFDFITFCGGLQQCGVKKHFRGSQRYTISSYKTLDHLLGSNWHVRVCNKNGDYCYATLNTVEFYLYRRRPLIEYIPSSNTSNNEPIEITRELGHVLVFSFIRGDGIPANFGKYATVFT